MRSTAEVFDDHLKRRTAGDLEGDLEHNYAPDVVFLCEHGPMTGRDSVRQSAEQLAKQLPDAAFEYPVKHTKGDYALLSGGLIPLSHAPNMASILLLFATGG